VSVWSAETLLRRLNEVVSPAIPAAVDGAAYTLKIGNEAYVSPSSPDGRDSAVIRQLQVGQDVMIPAGQYAFLITAETVMVPNDAMALISIKARIKWRGLVNVSGFHVDPGYTGKLIFGVFNAGPSTIHLRNGEDCFLIWFLSLDHPTERLHKGRHDAITSDIIGPISGEWKTIDMLDSRLHEVERQQASARTAFGVTLTLGAAIVASFIIFLLQMDISARHAAQPTATPSTSKISIPSVTSATGTVPPRSTQPARHS